MLGSISSVLVVGVLSFGISGCIVVPAAAPDTTTPDAPVVQNFADPDPNYQPPPPDAAVVYQNDLQPYGRWISYDRYGRCWAPNYVPNGWRPYTVGHWVYADDGSCCWVSEGPERDWGGIVYHYGQWAFTPDYGWIWVPGTTWAPAWVAWREGGGYCGWAPLPPEACRGDVTYVQADRYVPADRYVYVDDRDVNVVQINQRIVRNNVTIINKTKNITNITVVNNHVVNQGVPTGTVERASGRRVQRTAVAEASTPEDTRRLANSGVPVRYRSAAIEKVRTQLPATVTPNRDARIDRPQQNRNRGPQVQEGQSTPNPARNQDQPQQLQPPADHPRGPDRSDQRQHPNGQKQPGRNGRNPQQGDKPNAPPQ